MSRFCAYSDGCLRTVTETGLAFCPEPLCERDWANPTLAEELAWIKQCYGPDVHPDVWWLAGVASRVLEVVAAHEAAAEGQPLGWAADIRNAFEVKR